jgi:hypothetical protein
MRNAEKSNADNIYTNGLPVNKNYFDGPKNKQKIF